MRVLPYGAWPSPLDPARVARAGRRLDEVRIDDGAVHWLESRPEEGGRQVVVRQRRDGRVEDVVPSGFDARTRVHEYGGGSYLVTGGTVWFSHLADQRLYRFDASDAGPRPITPEGPHRYADGRLYRGGRAIVCVRETHPPGVGPAGAVDELVAVPADGGDDPVVLASGRDFYAAPRPSPDGRTLAFLAWDHPRMPWDGTELHLAEVRDDGTLGALRRVAGGPEESVTEPSFDPDGRLYFTSDRNGWWNLYRDGDGEPLCAAEAEFGAPPWQLGGARYGFLPDGRVVCVRFAGGADQLCVLDPDGGRLDPLTVPFSAVRSVATSDGVVAFVGASPREGAQVVALDVDREELGVLRRSDDEPLDEAWISEPEALTVPVGDEATHTLLHRPHNPGARGRDGELPPLVVAVHGGPTAHRTTALDLDVQFFTTRGFAVAELNYRGSTGYGRAYRQALDGRWGIVDVEDAVAVVWALAERGEIDPRRVVIRGGSAGGYTVLRALTESDVFAAGASYFGVVDVRALAAETHKFESRYMERLIPPADYDERSPINHLDRLRTPLIVLQGRDDPVVPLSQAEALVAALAERGVIHEYVVFDGEQHGFRRAENIAHAYRAELEFYGRVLGFTPDLPVPPPPEL